MKVKSAVLKTGMAFALISGACSSNSDDSPGSGGKTSNGGATASGGKASSEGGAGGTCSDVDQCGGSVVGTWSVASSCLSLTGELDLGRFGVGCASTPVTGSLQVTGTWTAKADGTVTDNTVTSGTEHFDLAPACLTISSAPVTCEGAANLLINAGYSTLTCSPVASGGCTCSATVQQNGGLAVVSPAPSTSGNYTTANNVITVSGDVGNTKYAYCASGNKLTLTPQSATPHTSGTIVFTSNAMPGSGGSTGAGGNTASGGSAGSAAGGAAQGGSVASGGRANSGGGSALGGQGGTAGMAAGGSSGAAGSTGTATGPCDIYQSGGTPCIAAHSTVRALFGAYNGKLYQVRNAAGATKDISTLSPGGAADGPGQDTFCAGTTCVITVIYDQSGKGNDLWYQGSTKVPGSPQSSPAKATSESLMLNGHKVYSLYINPGNSYWVDASKAGIATGSQPEGMYMVTSGKHYNSGCCFDYGNSETDRKADGAGTMDAINLSTTTAWGTGAGAGPWVMADLEYGLFSQGSSGKNQNDPAQTSTYITAILKNNGTTEFALRGGDSQTGNLSTYYKGGLPGGWSPMKKQGAIVLGSGGDCCKPDGGANLSDGTFYEGAVVFGYPSDATENEIQANIVSAKYGK